MFSSEITNIGHYNSEMRKPLEDKAFFLPLIEDADIIVDYGCADGLLIDYARSQGSKAEFIGFDISEPELELARKNNPGVKFFSNFGELLNYLFMIRKGRKVAVVCNSLIHEVYHYGGFNEITDFWVNIGIANFDWIVIRDMSVSKAILGKANPDDVFKVHVRGNQKMIEEFEAVWGSLSEQKNLVHFLLKYRYHYNWDREVKENYLSVFTEDLLSAIPRGYNTVHFERFIVPFIANTIYQDFGITLNNMTHVKLIFKRN